jgi:hypothetical protein
MPRLSENAVSVCCECVPDSNLGIALHMMTCERHGPGWHRKVIKREDGLVQPAPSLPEVYSTTARAPLSPFVA